MSVDFPEGVPVDGNVKVMWVPAIADTTEPILAEVNAAGALDLTCFIPAGAFSPNGDVTSIEDPRLCSRQVFEDFGSFSYSIDEIQYVVDPQDTSPSGGNAAALKLVPNTAGFLVIRWGAAYETAFAADDVVDVYPVKCGPQIKSAPERNSKLKARQKLYVTGPAYMDVEVAAS